MMNGMMGIGMGLWMLIVVVTVLAVLVVAVLAGVWLLRRLRADRSRSEHTAGGGVADHGRQTPTSQAVDVLDHRYAAGEIDDDEYERRLSTLGRR